MREPAATADLIVVGAGPAGLAAAVAALEAGLRVVLVDSGARPGGQFHRHRAGGIAQDADLHHGLAAFERVLSDLDRYAATGALTYAPHHHVWTIGRTDGAPFTIRALDRSSRPPTERIVRGRGVILATGAHDRAVPFPGWDLPGVITAGGAQALLKGQGVAVGARVLVAGTGPFLLPVAAGLVRRGVRVVGVHDANAATGWLRQPAAWGTAATKLPEAVGYLTTLGRHRVRVSSRSVVVSVSGGTRVEAVTTARVDPAGNVRPSTSRTMRADAVAVGVGFTPQVELASSLGCQLRTDVDGSVIVQVDQDQRTTVEEVWVAGEMTGVGGAALAAVEGELAGRAAAARLLGETKRKSPSIRRLRRRRASLRRFAAAIQRVYPEPGSWRSAINDDTVICRCEEVTAGRVREATALGAADARAVKLLSRAGMGWCQGRMCGHLVTRIVADGGGAPADATQTARRPLATPVPLGLLASDGEPSSM